MKHVYTLLITLLVFAVVIPAQAQSVEEEAAAATGQEMLRADYQLLDPVFTGTSRYEETGKSASLIINHMPVAYQEDRGKSKRWFIIIGAAAVTAAGAYFIFRDTGSEPPIPMPPGRPD